MISESKKTTPYYEIGLHICKYARGLWENSKTSRIAAKLRIFWLRIGYNNRDNWRSLRKSVPRLDLCFQQHLQRYVSSIEVTSSTEVVQGQTVSSYTSISAAKAWFEQWCVRLLVRTHFFQWISRLQSIFWRGCQKAVHKHTQHSAALMTTPTSTWQLLSNSITYGLRYQQFSRSS